MDDLLKKYNPRKLNKLSFAEEAQLKQEMFLSLKPVDRLKHSEMLAKKIWGKKYRYKTLRGVKVRIRKVTT